MSEAAANSPPPLYGFKRVLVTFALGLAAFMNVLDITIANVSVPSIAGDLGVSFTQGTWIITSYAVSEAIMLPLTGWLAGRFGQVRMFVTATLLFTLTSMICGLAPSFAVLLAARVLQGATGAAMIPLSQTLLTSSFPPEKRGKALGLWVMTTVLAPIVGPLAGGWLTEYASWHWIFLINLPVGLLVGSLSWALLRKRETPRQKNPVDFVGLALLAIGVGALQILLDKGNESDWFESGFIIALACVSLLALAAFIAWELGNDHPVVDLSLFATRNFLTGVLCMTLGGMAFFGVVVVLPLWLQSYQGYDSLHAGQVMAFTGLLALFIGPMIGANLYRLDVRSVATFGFCTFAAVTLWSSNFSPELDFSTAALSRLLTGIGISCFFLPINVIALSGLSPRQMAGASGLLNFMRNLGYSFGAAGFTSLWDHRGILHHAQMAESVTRYDAAALDYLTRLAGQGLTGEPALAYIDRQINAQAYLMATDDVMVVAGVMMLSLVLVVWRARPPFAVQGGGGH